MEPRIQSVYCAKILVFPLYLCGSVADLKRRRIMGQAAMQSLTTPAFEDVFRAHERFLWGLCYRMTGNAADADDLVQETFVRAWKQPPARTDEPWRPWLTRVAMNLCRDLLRRRRTRHSERPWLPSPTAT